MTTQRVSAGFIPLVDAAPLVVAAKKGFAEEHGIALELKRSNSWAALRDRLSVGDVEAAHMLAPIVIASQLNLGNPKAPMIAPCGLSMNGNAISVSVPLFEAMRATGWSPSRDPARAAQAVAAVAQARQREGQEPLTFASVYPFSSHSYELRYWLASAGLDPDEDVALTIVPPPMIVDAVADGHIDGFCVGAPWSGVGAESGHSRIIAYKADIWPHGPEKVLALRERWADEHVDQVKRLVRALKDAASWCSKRGNREELAQMMSADDLLATGARTIKGALDGRLSASTDDPVEDHLLFEPKIAGYPWPAHALWFYAQMVRWGQVGHSDENLAAVKKAYRPDLYRLALDVGAPDAAVRDRDPTDAPPSRWIDSAAAEIRSFDGRLFDPEDLDGYFESLRHAPA